MDDLYATIASRVRDGGAAYFGIANLVPLMDEVIRQGEHPHRCTAGCGIGADG